MNRATFVALGASAFISSTAAISTGAGSAVPAQGMSRAEYLSALRSIEAERPAALGLCDSLAPAAEGDACRAQAAAAEMVRTAEVEQAHRGTERTARALQRARIDARYQLDRSRCATLGGLKRDRCLVQAHAARGRALLDAAHPYEVRS